MTNPRRTVRVMLACLLLACVAFPTPASASNTVWFIAHEYVPFYVKEPLPNKGLQGMGRGFVIDIVQAAYDAVGVEAKFDFEPIPRSIRAMPTDHHVGIIGSRDALHADIRTANVDSVNLGYFHIRLHYFTSTLGNKPTTFDALKDLGGYSVASIRGGPVRLRLQQAGLEVHPYASLEQGAMMLDAGRVDYWAAVGLSARHIVERYLPERLDDLAHMEKALFEGSVDINFSTRHSEYELRSSQFKKGMGIIRRNGTYLSLLESYFGKGNVPDFAFASWGDYESLPMKEQ